jgi:hypothetical protein
MSKGIKHFLVLVNAKCAEVTEVVIHFFLLGSWVIDVRQLNPFLIQSLKLSFFGRYLQLRDVLHGLHNIASDSWIL